MKLNVIKLSQRDPRWQAQRLGTVNGSTIGGYGCIITCMSMLAQYYGHKILPNQMDDWLTANQGYVQGNLYRNDAFGREFSDCKSDGVIFCTDVPAPLNKIDENLNAGKPVVVMVDFDHDIKNGVQTHFVLITGKTEDNRYIINDPWFGDEVFIDARYGNAATAINQINLFSGPVPVAAQPSAGSSDTSAGSAGSVSTPAYPDLSAELAQEKNTTKVLREYLTAARNIIYGKGWTWTKLDKLKQLLPQ